MYMEKQNVLFYEQQSLQNVIFPTLRLLTRVVIDNDGMLISSDSRDSFHQEKSEKC